MGSIVPCLNHLLGSMSDKSNGMFVQYIPRIMFTDPSSPFLCLIVTTQWLILPMYFRGLDSIRVPVPVTQPWRLSIKT